MTVREKFYFHPPAAPVNLDVFLALAASEAVIGL
jgi:hypothetical protein